MFVDILILLVGLALLLYSADMMINSSDSIAKKFQLSPILIGLTIVAFGTSAPELVITLFAAFKEIPASDAIIGNIIGSNIANILLILGTASLFFKIDLSNIGLKDNSFLIILTSYFAAMFYIASSLNFTIIIGLIVFVILFLNLLKNYESNNEEVKYIDCSDVKLPYFRNLINDVINRTETACTQELTYLSMELAIKAQLKAETK